MYFGKKKPCKHIPCKAFIFFVLNYQNTETFTPPVERIAPFPEEEVPV